VTKFKWLNYTCGKWLLLSVHVPAPFFTSPGLSRRILDIRTCKMQLNHPICPNFFFGGGFEGHKYNAGGSFSVFEQWENMSEN